MAAAAISAVLVIGAAVLRIGFDYLSFTPLPERSLGVLVATALLLGALLALPRSDSVTWALLSLSSALSAFETLAVVRGLELITYGTSDELVILAGSALVAATGIAAAYAARPRAGWSRGAQVAVAVVGLALVATVLAMIWAVGQAEASRTAIAASPTPLRIASRIALTTWVGAFVVGVARDLGPPALRAAGRLPSSGGGLWRYLRLFADELMPGRAADRREAAEAERARLAADLHALVLPDLRRAAAAAETAGAPEAMQLDLRRALEDVEQLMHERQSIVLEQFGLVAALEWLAERTEERSPLRVALEIDGDVPDGPKAFDPTVARAAFRIALLALDNVVRHADASTATLRLALDRDALMLSITDDGHVSAGPQSPTGRGLVDMRAEASASGGSVEIRTSPAARVQARWPRSSIAGKHASQPAGLADRRSAPAP